MPGIRSAASAVRSFLPSNRIPPLQTNTGNAGRPIQEYSGLSRLRLQVVSSEDCEEIGEDMAAGKLHFVRELAGSRSRIHPRIPIIYPPHGWCVIFLNLPGSRWSGQLRRGLAGAGPPDKKAPKLCKPQSPAEGAAMFGKHRYIASYMMVVVSCIYIMAIVMVLSWLREV